MLNSGFDKSAEAKTSLTPGVPSTWRNPPAVATFLPDGETPLSINGIELAPWRDHPKTTEGWNFVDGADDKGSGTQCLRAVIASPVKRQVSCQLAVYTDLGHHLAQAHQACIKRYQFKKESLRAP